MMLGQNHRIQRLLRSFSPLYTELRHVKDRPQFKAQLEPELLEQLKNRQIHPRKHPGANLQRVFEMPKKLVKTFEKVIGDHPAKKLLADGKQLDQYLKARHIPPEDGELKQKASDIQAQVEEELNVDVSKLNDDQFEHYKKVVKKKTDKVLKERTFAWKPLEYDEYRSKMYLFGRATQDYATLNAIFGEIKRRDPDFKPKSFFDFGSGVGTGTWIASDLWKDSIFEYFNVDSSTTMNDLAELILKGGDDNKERSLRNVFYRQFLGAPTVGYDVVLSAFSLIELPNRKNRLEVLTNLWTRCNGYLVLVEMGTNAGFKLITEARNFLINLKGDDSHLFAPCPHELECPRIKFDKTPCNFEVRHFPLTFARDRGEPKKDRFSYVVFSKGRPIDAQWPRLVRETLVRTRHTFCRLCTVEGNLREIIVTQNKHGKEVYQCARNSKWGDRLPMSIENLEENVVENKEN